MRPDLTGCIFFWNIIISDISITNIWNHAGIIVQWNINEPLKSYIIDYGTSNGTKTFKHNIRCTTLEQAMKASNVTKIYINDKIVIPNVHLYYDDNFEPTPYAIKNMKYTRYNIFLNNCQHYVRSCRNRLDIQLISEVYALLIAPPLLLLTPWYNWLLTLLTLLSALSMLTFGITYSNLIICNKCWSIDHQGSLTSLI